MCGWNSENQSKIHDCLPKLVIYTAEPWESRQRLKKPMWCLVLREEVKEDPGTYSENQLYMINLSKERKCFS
jgi:hypothetical protein